MLKIVGKKRPDSNEIEKEIIIEIKPEEKPEKLVFSYTKLLDVETTDEDKRAKLIGCIIGGVLGAGLYWPNAFNNAGPLAGLASFLSNTALTFNDLKKLWEEIEKVLSDEKIDRAEKAKFIAKCLAKVVPIGLLGVPIVHLASAGPGFYKLLTEYVLSTNFKEEVLDRMGGPAATTVLLGIFSVIPISFVYISSFDNLCKSSVDQYYKFQYWRLKLQGKNPYKENKNILLNDIKIFHEKFLNSYNKVKGELHGFQKEFIERVDKKSTTIEVVTESDTKKDETLILKEELARKKEKNRNLAKELHREYYLMYTPWTLYLTVEVPLKILFLGNALNVGLISSANASNTAKNLSIGWQWTASIYSLWPGLLNIGLYTLSAKNAVNYLIEILLTISNVENWTTLERLPRLAYISVMTALCLIVSVAASPAALQVFGNALTSPALGWARGIVIIDTIFALLNKYGWISAMVNSTSVNFRALINFLNGIKKDLLSQKLAEEHKKNESVMTEVKEHHIKRVEYIIKMEALLIQKEKEYELLDAKTNQLHKEYELLDAKTNQLHIEKKDADVDKIKIIEKQIFDNEEQLDIINSQKINIENELAELTILKDELKKNLVEKHKKELEEVHKEELEKLIEKHKKELEEIEKGPSSDLQAAIEYAELGESIANEIAQEKDKSLSLEVCKEVEKDVKQIIINVEEIQKKLEENKKTEQPQLLEIKEEKQKSYINCWGIFGDKQNKHSEGLTIDSFSTEILKEESNVETKEVIIEIKKLKEDENKRLLLGHDKLKEEVIYKKEELEPEEGSWFSKNCLVM